ncbi:MAG: cation:proton antiporter [Saprospiraceae bacterium]|nr:cation:proton antiporter [Saprospiraceae bacterium]MDZ4704409.1 cation:proton antiporter [Saprospiraceae bacterium]
MTGLLLSVDFSLPLKNPVLVFSILLFIILFSPILLRKFRLPGIIGLILSGILVGPYGFNLIERNEAIVLFSTIGLLYIMFLAGLELDMNEFKKNRYKSILFGFFTFAIPISIGYPVCHYLLGYDVLASVMIASMFATHTLVAYPIASRLGIVKDEAVAITVGGTIITDTAVLLMLAVITGSKQGGLDQAFWIRLFISLTIFSVIVFYLLPPVARWFFRNIEGEKTSQYIFVLALVFLSAFLAEVAGVEPIIGAFMSGLALNSLIPHTSPLMNRIEFVGNALFIPFFLISVGMLVDIKVLSNGPWALIVAATLSVVAITGKWAAAWITQRVFRYSRYQRNVIWGLSNAHAAATLAVILVGYNIGIIDENVLNGTIILILITCLVASFVTERAGRNLAIAELEKLPEIKDLDEKILVPISNPATIEPLMDLAILLKDRRSSQPITALSVVQDDDEARERVIQNKQMLEKAIIHAAATDTKVTIDTRVALNVGNGISQYVKEKMISMVLIGWTGKAAKVEGKIFGTALDQLIQSNSQMVMVTQLRQPINITRRIVAAIPANAQYEVGFAGWLQKLHLLAKETSSEIHLHTTPKTFEAIRRYFAQNRILVSKKFYDFEDWEDFLILAKSVSRDDLLVVVCARKGSISYNSYLDEIPGKLPKYFKENNFMVIFPEQPGGDMLDSVITEEDISLSPIQDNIQRLSRYGKVLRRLFGKKS